MKLYQVSVFVENKEGRLAEVTKILAENNINIKALSIADTTNFGILRMIVDNPKKANEIFMENGFTISLTDVIAMEVADQPGGLAGAIKVLSENQISIEYMYAFIGYQKDKKDRAVIILRVDNIEKASEILTKNNITLLTANDIYNEN